MSGKKVAIEVEMKQKHHTNGQVTPDKRKRTTGLGEKKGLKKNKGDSECSAVMKGEAEEKLWRAKSYILTGGLADCCRGCWDLKAGVTCDWSRWD